MPAAALAAGDELPEPGEDAPDGTTKTSSAGCAGSRSGCGAGCDSGHVGRIFAWFWQLIARDGRYLYGRQAAVVRYTLVCMAVRLRLHLHRRKGAAWHPQSWSSAC